MVDIVSANEFTFTPSAFLAAYIEQNETTTVTDTTSNGGSLVTNPNTIENFTSEVTNDMKVFSPSDGAILNYNDATTTGPLPHIPTLNTAAGSSVSITSSGVEIVGKTISDTRTITKTTQTSTGVSNTVVLILSYGQFRSKCADAQATVTKIYQEVASYLNSL